MTSIIPSKSGKPRPLIIFGTGGQAKDTISFLLDLPKSKWNLVGLLDDNPAKKGTEIMGVPVLGGREWFRTVRFKPDIFLTPGDPRTRSRLAEELRSSAHSFPSFVHPRAVLNLKHTVIGEGCFVAPGVVVTNGVSIGSFVFLHACSTVNHDSKVSDFCMLSTGVNLGGATVLETGVFMGINSSTLPGVRVGEFALIGGGAVCTKDIPGNVTAAGVPAKVLQTGIRARKSTAKPGGKNGRAPTKGPN